jgi:hypothetical protein
VRVPTPYTIRDALVDERASRDRDCELSGAGFQIVTSDPLLQTWRLVEPETGSA